MIYKFCVKTDPGRVRRNNEDVAATDEASGVAILADGMGGYNAGEVASGMATDFIKTNMMNWLGEVGTQASNADVMRAMEICVGNANLAVFTAARDNPQYAGMGTTLVVGVFRGDSLLLGHIGDSRCYRLRAGQMEQITKDHSLLQEQIDAGLITPEQAASAANKNLVTRAVGVEEVVLLELNEFRVEPQDLYLMCSDGLSDMVGDAEIAELLAMPGSLEQRAEWLIDSANGYGGRDNVTVLLTQVSPSPVKRGLMARLLRK